MMMNILTTAAALSDQDLLARLGVLAGRERETAAELVAHLAALDARPAASPATGCPELGTEAPHIHGNAIVAGDDRTGDDRTGDDRTGDDLRVIRTCAYLDGSAGGVDSDATSNRPGHGAGALPGAVLNRRGDPRKAPAPTVPPPARDPGR